MTFTDQIQICIRLGRAVFQRRADDPGNKERNMVIAAVSFIAEDYISMIQDHFLGPCPYAESIGEVLGEEAEKRLSSVLAAIDATLPEMPQLELVLQLHFFTCAVRLAIDQETYPSQGVVEVEEEPSQAKT